MNAVHSSVYFQTEKLAHAKEAKHREAHRKV